MRQLKEIVHDRQRGAGELLGEALDWLARHPEMLAAPSRAAVLRLVRSGRPVMPGFRVLADRLERLLERGEPASAVVRRLREDWLTSEERVAEIFSRIAAQRGLSSAVTISWSSAVRRSLSAAGMRRVLVLESLPGGEGRLTAEWFERHTSAEVELVPDRRRAEAVRRTDAVVMGADAVLAGKGVINKVGSRELARLAAEAGRPVFVVASTWKRITADPAVLLAGEPEGIFEFVPQDLLTAVITDTTNPEPCVD